MPEAGSGAAIRPLVPEDREWVRRHVAEHWSSERVIAHGVEYYPHTLPGFLAEQDGAPLGLVTYHVEGESCEIVTLASDRPGMGIGTALIDAVEREARRQGCRRLWLITTNDNLDALRFYQKRGFVLAALHRNAIERSRQLKPEISLYGNDGIPIRDELELERPITDPFNTP